MKHPSAAAARYATPIVRWIALLALCSAYLQGALTKLFNFDAAIAEMSHFGLQPAALFAIGVITFELAASAAILAGWYRWLAAGSLAVFTLAATFVANRFWELPLADRIMVENAFFEHLGLVGAFVIVAWHDLRNTRESAACIKSSRPWLRSLSG